MKNANNHTNGEHIGDLRVAYLEDMLTPEEKSRVEEHLKSCPQCSAELEELSQWTAIVRENKEAFCPETWELFDLVRRGDDLSEELSAHLDQCDSCRENLEDFRMSAQQAPMPIDLWARMTRPAPTEAKERPSRQASWLDRLSNLADQFRVVFKIPVMAFGTVAAAVLLAVLLLPTWTTQPTVGLSSVKWEASSLQRQLMGTEPTPSSGEIAGIEKKRLAIVVLFRDIRPPFTQEAVDSLYAELEPSPEIQRRFDVVTPAEFKDAVTEQKVPITNRKEMLKGLREGLGVPRAVVITLASRGDRFEMESEFTDTGTGKVIRKQEMKGLTESELSSKIRDAALSVVDADSRSD